jgi:hypothetical protein
VALDCRDSRTSYLQLRQKLGGNWPAGGPPALLPTASAVSLRLSSAVLQPIRASRHAQPRAMPLILFIFYALPTRTLKSRCVLFPGSRFIACLVLLFNCVRLSGVRSLLDKGQRPVDKKLSLIKCYGRYSNLPFAVSFKAEMYADRVKASRLAIL